MADLIGSVSLEAFDGRIEPFQENVHVLRRHQGQIQTALDTSESLIKDYPNSSLLYNIRGVCHKAHGQLEAAVKCYEQALAIKPDFAEVHSNLGNTLKKLGQLESAVKNYEKALAIKPDYAEAHCNLGYALEKLGQVDAGINHYERALAIKPDFPLARFNLSSIQLTNGFLSEGFQNYEARWQWTKFTSPKRQFSIPRWTGEPLTGKNILLWAEQGIGDEVQYASLIPEFKDLDCHVGIECAAKLIEIFQWSFPWAEVREAGAVNCEGNEIYNLFDYQIPFGSIAPLFRKTMDDFSVRQKPFIPRLKEGEKKVRDKLKMREGELLIGLGWRSSKQSFHDLSVEDLAPLKSLKNVVFLAVQYGECLAELNQLRSLGLPIHYYTDVDQKDDISSTCALLGACDLVFSPGTAVYQISASLGVPTICFDAFKSRQNRIPWHPTSRYLELLVKGNEEEIYSLIRNCLNSGALINRIIIEVIYPAIDHIRELFDSGKIGSAEQNLLRNIISKSLSIFNQVPVVLDSKKNVVVIAADPESILISESASASYHSDGWNVSHLGDMSYAIDVLFDLDFQKLVRKIWKQKSGILLVVIFSQTSEGLSFFADSINPNKTKSDKQIKLALCGKISKKTKINSDLLSDNIGDVLQWSNTISQNIK